MKILITGATGALGQALVPKLIKEGHELTVFSRNVDRAAHVLGGGLTYQKWDGKNHVPILNNLQGCNAIINLAGENIAGTKWTYRQKQKIRESRVLAGLAISRAINELGHKPGVVFQASAIGFYGDCKDAEITENASKGQGFLANVCEAWEGALSKLDNKNTRVVYLRTGVVLANNGGAFPKMRLPVNLFVGAYPGLGHQYLPWIHIHDWLEAILFLLKSEKVKGAYNLTAPNPVTMKTFFKVLGNALKRPIWMPIPPVLVKSLWGQMGEETLLAGQNAIPAKLLKEGFVFTYPEVSKAIKALV